jgi:hypothetical protein
MRIQALVGEGSYDEARRLSVRFKRDFPGSLMQGAVDAQILSIH